MSLFLTVRAIRSPSSATSLSQMNGSMSIKERSRRGWRYDKNMLFGFALSSMEALYYTFSLLGSYRCTAPILCPTPMMGWGMSSRKWLTMCKRSRLWSIHDAVYFSLVRDLSTSERHTHDHFLGISHSRPHWPRGSQHRPPRLREYGTRSPCTERAALPIAAHKAPTRNRIKLRAIQMQGER